MGCLHEISISNTVVVKYKISAALHEFFSVMTDMFMLNIFQFLKHVCMFQHVVRM